jgi:hypothetical protein|tara:strand:- start:1485 stop:1964 length:480 start_codon:yes stop_codon:yes gene_type:complete
MDPVTIGVALAGAKKLLEISSNITDVVSSIENILNLTDKVEKTKKKDKNDTSMKSVITDVVTERNNKTALRNLSISVDDKFGFGTWDAIEKERQRRLVIDKENRVKEAKAKKIKERKSKEFYDNVLHWLSEFGKLLLVLALSGSAGYYIYLNRCVDGVC